MKYHLIVPCLVLLCASCGKAPPTQTSNNPEAPVTGPEIWNVNGTNFNIEGTACLVMGNGQTLFVVKAITDFAPGAADQPIARALAKYAVDNGYPGKVKQSYGNGKPTPFSGGIGVALFRKQGVGSMAVAAEWKYHFTVKELQQPDGEPANPQESSPADAGSKR